METQSTFNKIMSAIVGIMLGGLVMWSMGKAGMIEAGVILGITVGCFVYTHGE